MGLWKSNGMQWLCFSPPTNKPNFQSCCLLQVDINRADEWAQKWKMKFNVDKCKVLHFNKCKNNHYDYYIHVYMADQHTMCKMTSTPQEKDIGVIFDNNLQFNSHITTTVKKCQQISIIKRSFDFIDENIMTLSTVRNSGQTNYRKFKCHLGSTSKKTY